MWRRARTGRLTPDLRRIAAGDKWTGYVGAPRYASPELGRRLLVGIGFMLRPSDQVMVALDYTRVGYSELRAFAQSFANSSKANNFVLRNGNEFHVGLEYALSNLRLRYVPAARVGMWYDPEHAVRYDTPPAVDLFDAIYAAALPGNRSQVPFAAGGGVSISQHLNRLEIDAAVDFSRYRGL